MIPNYLTKSDKLYADLICYPCVNNFFLSFPPPPELVLWCNLKHLMDSNLEENGTSNKHNHYWWKYFYICKDALSMHKKHLSLGLKPSVKQLRFYIIPLLITIFYNPDNWPRDQIKKYNLINNHHINAKWSSSIKLVKVFNEHKRNAQKNHGIQLF